MDYAGYLTGIGCVWIVNLSQQFVEGHLGVLEGMIGFELLFYRTAEDVV